jgi:hypothetical protein
MIVGSMEFGEHRQSCKRAECLRGVKDNRLYYMDAQDLQQSSEFCWSAAKGARFLWPYA